MKINRTNTGIIITKDSDEFFTINEWLDELYDSEEIEVESDKSQVYFDEFMKNGSVTLPRQLNKVVTLESLAVEPIKETKTVVDTQLTNLLTDNKVQEETIIEEFTFEEELESTQTIGEVVTDYINNGWLIEKTRVQRGYATYESLVKFKSNGAYSIIKKRIAGPEIKYLESIIKEMRIGETGANGLPVIQKFVDEKKDVILLTIISNEHLIIKYKLKPRAYFKQQQQLAVMCSDF